MMNYKILPMDVESYPNYLLIGIKDTLGRYYSIDSVDKLEYFIPYLDNLVFAGFNSINYDSVIVDYVIANYRYKSWEQLTKDCYKLTKQIIEKGDSYFKLRRSWDIPNITNNLDLSYYAQNMSLKELGIRMHHPILETLPINPDEKLTEDGKALIREYNKNDLDITDKLLNSVKSRQVEAKQNLIDAFNLPLSEYAKTDGVLAEDILCEKNRKPVNKMIARFVNKQNIKFDTPELKDLLETIENYWFEDEGGFRGTLDLFGLNIAYGVGGLHACIDKYQGSNLIDIDVASYYPNIMKNNDLLPNTVRDKTVYYNMITDRVQLKKSNPILANAYKVILNSVFGKLKYFRSKLYDIESFYNVTLTGQLLMLRLCELLNEAGYKIIYVNTDGLMIEDNGDASYKEICEAWCKEFSYELEYNPINKAWIRDVSNYILDEGKLKLKGDFDISPDKKNNAYHRISWIAVQEYLLNGTPIEETIRNSRNIEDFVLYLKYSRIYVDTKIEYSDGREEPFDRVLRFYWSKSNNNRVVATKGDTGSDKVMSDGNNIGRLQNLNTFTDFDDIDYDRYINRAYEKLNSLLDEPIENNAYVDSLLKGNALSYIKREYFGAGIGKRKLNKPILSPDVTTLTLKTGSETGYLVVDVDYPESDNARKILNYLRKDDFIVYSSEYSIDDVFNGSCRYKVIYKYDGKDIPKKKGNVNVEVFYKHPIAIAGKRDDGYEYINNNGKIQEINYDLNDIVQVKIPFKFL